MVINKDVLKHQTINTLSSSELNQMALSKSLELHFVAFIKGRESSETYKIKHGVENTVILRNCSFFAYDANE